MAQRTKHIQCLSFVHQAQAFRSISDDLIDDHKMLRIDHITDRDRTAQEETVDLDVHKLSRLHVCRYFSLHFHSICIFGNFLI